MRPSQTAWHGMAWHGMAPIVRLRYLPWPSQLPGSLVDFACGLRQVQRTPHRRKRALQGRTLSVRMSCDPQLCPRRIVIRPLQRVQSLKLGAAAQMMPIVAGYGVNLLTTPYVVDRLGLHDFGVWSLTGAIAQYGALLDLGVSRAASRFVALFHAKGDIKSEKAVVGICVTTLVALGTLLGGLTLLGAGFLDRVLRTGDRELVCLLLLSSVSILIVGLLARVLAAASVGRGRYVPANIGVAILSTLQFSGGPIALVVQPSLMAFAAGTVAGTLLGFGAVVIAILLDERRIMIGKPDARLLREILAYGVKTQVAAAGDTLFLQSGKLIAGIMVGPAAAGVYELASRLAMGAQAIGGTSAAALTPHITRSYVAGGMDSVLSQYEHLTRRNTAVTIFIPLAMAATAFSGIPLWLGNGHDLVVLVLLALLPGIAVNVSTAVCTSVLSAMGRPDITALVAVLGGVLQSAFTVALGYVFGFVGIAAAFAIGAPAITLVGVWYMQRRVGIPMKLYLHGVRGPFAVGALAISLALPIGLLAAPHSRESAVWPFLASAVLFGATYALFGWRRDYLPRLPLRRLDSHVSGRHRLRN
jgi:O-antigen/teichoic acid export membrane protein